MDTTVLEKETNLDNTQVAQEDSVEYKSGGFNMWGVNVENDSKSSRHSSFTEDSDDTEDLENKTIDPLSAGQMAANITPEETVQTQEPVSEEDSEEKQIDNFAYYVAKQMIQEGALPPYEEVDEDITFEDIYENYKTIAEEKVKGEVLQQVQSTLTSAGVTDENLVLLQAIQNGVPLDELYEVNKYQKYSQFDESTDDDLKLEVIREWYKSRSLSDREINRNLEAIEISDEIDAEFEDAKNFFAKTIEEYHNTQRQIALQELEQRKLIQLNNEEILKRAINQGVLANEKLTSEQSKQIQRDIYERSKVYNIDGQQIPLSPFEEFLYLMNNDFEFQLYNYKNYRFKNYETEILKAQAQEQADRDYLEAFKKSQGKSAMKGSLKKKSNNTQNGFSAYINETGGRTYEF